MTFSTLLCAVLAMTQDTAKPGEQPAESRPSEQVSLRYKFRPGEDVRWKVEHKADVRTAINNTQQTAVTVSRSVKVWRILSVDEQGQATFEQYVESIDMLQELTDRQPVRYNSATDAEPPAEFENAARSVGVKLATITLDALGKVTSREQHHDKEAAQQSTAAQITIPLPAEPVGPGSKWNFPYDVEVEREGGGKQKIKTRQVFVLETIKDGIAEIAFETQILTPVKDPKIEAQLIQRFDTGRTYFDVAAGRIVRQEVNLDKVVLGYQGPASSMHYVTRSTDALITDGKPATLKPVVQTARAKAGPAAPK
jgi:hypothetical protein